MKISSRDKIMFALVSTGNAHFSEMIWRLHPVVRWVDGKYHVVDYSAKYDYRTGEVREALHDADILVLDLGDLRGILSACKPDKPSVMFAVSGGTDDRYAGSSPMAYWVPVDDKGNVEVYRTPHGSICSRERREIPLPANHETVGDASGTYDGAVWDARCFWDVAEAAEHIADHARLIADAIEKSVEAREAKEAAELAEGASVIDRLSRFQETCASKAADAETRRKAAMKKESELDSRWASLSLAEKKALLGKKK